MNDSKLNQDETWKKEQMQWTIKTEDGTSDDDDDDDEGKSDRKGVSIKLQSSQSEYLCIDWYHKM